MCSFNPGDYLSEAISSILRQTYAHFELLVIDDGGTDGAVEAARNRFADTRIRWFCHENTGRPGTLNLAIGLARGEFYTIQDADDISHTSRLEHLVGAMRADPDIAAVSSGHELIIDGRVVAPRFRSKSREECRHDIAELRMPAHDPTALFRVSMVKTLRYEPTLRIAHAVDYILQVGEAWPMHVIGKCLYSYRVHSQSITKNDPRRRLEEVELVLQRACARRGLDPRSVLSMHRARLAKSGRNQILDNNLSADFIESVLDLRRSGRWLEACSTGLRCAQMHPLDVRYYKALAYAIAPGMIARRWRKSGRL